MNKLKCVVVDDEPLARAQLERYIRSIPFLEYCGSARDVIQAASLLKSTTPDLVFMDIRMPGMDGITFIKEGGIKAQVIIISAYPEHALEGFALQVTDYLAKPVSLERFLKACDRALALAVGRGVHPAVAEEAYIYVKNGQRFEKVIIKDILYIESKLNYVLIVTTRGRFIMYSSLKRLEQSLSGEHFIRIHKSYLVAIAALTRVQRHEVEVDGNTLPVSRSNSKKVMRLGRSGD